MMGSAVLQQCYLQWPLTCPAGLPTESRLSGVMTCVQPGQCSPRMATPVHRVLSRGYNSAVLGVLTIAASDYPNYFNIKHRQHYANYGWRQLRPIKRIAKQNVALNRHHCSHYILRTPAQDSSRDQNQWSSSMTAMCCNNNRRSDDGSIIKAMIIFQYFAWRPLVMVTGVIDRLLETRL